ELGDFDRRPLDAEVRPHLRELHHRRLEDAGDPVRLPVATTQFADGGDEIAGVERVFHADDVVVDVFVGGRVHDAEQADVLELPDGADEAHGDVGGKRRDEDD